MTFTVHPRSSEGAGRIYIKAFNDHKLYAIAPPGTTLWQSIGDVSAICAPDGPAIDLGGTIYYCGSNSIFALNPLGQVIWDIYREQTCQEPIPPSRHRP